MSGADPFDFRARAGQPSPEPSPPVGPPSGPPSWRGRVAVRSPGAAGPWLALGLVAAVLGVGLGGWSLLDPSGGWSLTLGFAGWVVAGPVAIGLLAVHTVRLTGLRAAALVDVRTPGIDAARRTVLLVAAAGVALAAWRIADWVGRS